jgi:hypothetical protein
MPAIDDARQMLMDLDPAAGPGGLPDERQRAQDLRRILASAPRPGTAARRTPSRRLVMAGGLATAVAAVAVTVAITQLGQPPAAAHAATPPVLDYRSPATVQPAAQRLRELADVAAAAPMPDRPARTIEHVRTANWFLGSQISRDTTISAVVPEERESWRTDDNGGRLVQRLLPPVFQSEADRQTWLRRGGTVNSGQEITDARAGQFPAGWAGPVPTDPTTLRQWITANSGERQDPVQYLEDIAELAGVRLLGPAERAAALRLLAELPGMTVAGTVVDRAGRTGEAFGMESDYSGLPTRHVVIIDPADGKLLGYEAMLTTTAGKLNVPIPSVISYRCYLVAEYAPMPR